ncbi:hypothetical protein NE237_006535 [Protea cynaroides]|uniref:Uncharacterized protein n=1 Tax=Protea cynaroides TaxID=273540 RepID=A0A9Q0KMP3_9MAGN|nr:hypothetical protein NE237_006535 [Protea cynaroides]
MGSPEEERLLLEVGLIENASRGQYTGDGSVDINGKPVLKQNTGNWRACLFILGTEFCECLSFCGIAANLVTYLTSNLHEGNASAARSVTTWSGTRSLAPLIGAVFSRFMLGKILDNCSFLHSLLHCRCLDKAAVVSDLDVKQGDFNPWRLCTVTQVEELKILIRMFPICATGIVFSAVYTQMFTMFVEQGMVMDTTIGSFTIPPASLLTFDIISVIVWVPMYDRLLVPLVRKFTGKERGFSELQRIGIGLFVSILSMAAAAIVEIKRLEIAKSLDLVDHKVTVVPMSILWQIPQYFLVGAAEVFTFIGQLQLFYDQSPHAMRSLFSALQLLTIALGNYLSSFILTIVTTITTKDGNPGWIPNNLNQGHLDYYFWLLAGLGFLNLVVYVFCITGYRCKKAP